MVRQLNLMMLVSVNYGMNTSIVYNYLYNTLTNLTYGKVNDSNGKI